MPKKKLDLHLEKEIKDIVWAILVKISIARVKAGKGEFKLCYEFNNMKWIHNRFTLINFRGKKQKFAKNNLINFAIQRFSALGLDTKGLHKQEIIVTPFSISQEEKDRADYIFSEKLNISKDFANYKIHYKNNPSSPWGQEMTVFGDSLEEAKRRFKIINPLAIISEIEPPKYLNR